MGEKMFYSKSAADKFIRELKSKPKSKSKAKSKVKKSKPSSKGQEEWSCQTCTFINTPKNSCCGMCQTPNPNKDWL